MTYLLDKLCYMLEHDPAFRSAFATSPETALAPYPLDPAARDEFLRADVAALWRRGVHPLSLRRMQACGPWGMSEQEFSRRMRAPATAQAPPPP